MKSTYKIKHIEFDLTQSDVESLSYKILISLQDFFIYLKMEGIDYQQLEGEDKENCAIVL